MNISAISDFLSVCASVHPDVAATPTQSAQEKFSAMFAQPADVASPDALLDAQTAFNQRIVDTEFTAKVAGSLTQSINKLANMQ